MLLAPLRQTNDFQIFLCSLKVNYCQEQLNNRESLLFMKGLRKLKYDCKDAII